jgi:hypothetical protein
MRRGRPWRGKFIPGDRREKCFCAYLRSRRCRFSRFLEHANFLNRVMPTLSCPRPRTPRRLTAKCVRGLGKQSLLSEQPPMIGARKGYGGLREMLRKRGSGSITSLTACVAARTARISSPSRLGLDFQLHGAASLKRRQTARVQQRACGAYSPQAGSGGILLPTEGGLPGQGMMFQPLANKKLSHGTTFPLTAKYFFCTLQEAIRG